MNTIVINQKYKKYIMSKIKIYQSLKHEKDYLNKNAFIRNVNRSKGKEPKKKP